MPAAGPAAFAAEVSVRRASLGGAERLGVTIRDLTAQKQALQEAVREARQRLEEHDRLRLQFVSNVSHELRTPLTSMIYAINNMLTGVVGPVPDRVRRYLEMLDADCKRLLTTVNDILDLHKIETGALSLAKRRVPLGRLVRHSAESLQVQAREKGLALKIDTSGARCFVDCDPAKMERVILNIVGNAIKFTPEGGAVEVTVADEPGRARRARIDIRDTGIGIPREALDKVAMRYFTVGEQATGSGLGLSISKEIVTLHGGRLEIQSPPPGAERGTLVSVILPTTVPPVVLLVDDDEGILKLLEDQVCRHGYQALKVTDGSKAEEMLRRYRPDAVILDLALPDFDGTELILRMKSEKAWAGVTIVVLTGAAIGPGKAEILRSFAIPTLTKPWEETELMDLVGGAFFGTGRRRRSGGKAS